MKKTAFILVLLLVALLDNTIYGNTLIRTADTEEGLYRYEFAKGLGFSSSLQNGQEADFFIFKFDNGVAWQLFKDGKEIYYENQQLLADPGTYSLRVWTDTDQGVFSFSIAAPQDLPNMEGFTLAPVVYDAQIILTGFHDGFFSYSFENGMAFKSSVPLGGISMTDVYFEFSEYLKYTVLYNGQPMTDTSNIFTEPGVYDITITTIMGIDPELLWNDTYYDSLMEKGLPSGYSTNFNFRILTRNVNSLRVYNAPRDFVITMVQKEGIDYPFHPESLWLLEDGIYEITQECPDYPEAKYSIKFNLDTKAPFLDFSIGLKGVTYDDVKIYPPLDCTVTVSREGNYYELVNNTLSQTGYFRVTAMDSAGNTRLYRIYIVYGIQLNLAHLTILLGGFITASVCAVLKGRNLNVR